MFSCVIYRMRCGPTYLKERHDEKDGYHRPRDEARDPHQRRQHGPGKAHEEGVGVDVAARHALLEKMLEL